MKIESRREQFHTPTLSERILGKLHIDIPLFICLLLISLLSFVILYSAGSQEMGLLVRQAFRVGLAYLLMTVLAHINPYQLKRYSALLFGIGIALLIAVLIMGHIGKGAQRWLDLGFFRFQPAELAKMIGVTFVARQLVRHQKDLLDFRKGVIAPITFLVPVWVLLLLQPDFGSTALLAGLVIIRSGIISFSSSFKETK